MLFLIEIESKNPDKQYTYYNLVELYGDNPRTSNLYKYKKFLTKNSFLVGRWNDLLKNYAYQIDTQKIMRFFTANILDYTLWNKKGIDRYKLGGTSIQAPEKIKIIE